MGCAPSRALQCWPCGYLSIFVASTLCQCLRWRPTRLGAHICALKACLFQGLAHLQRLRPPWLSNANQLCEKDASHSSHGPPAPQHSKQSRQGAAWHRPQGSKAAITAAQCWGSLQGSRAPQTPAMQAVCQLAQRHAYCSHSKCRLLDCSNAAMIPRR